MEPKPRWSANASASRRSGRAKEFRPGSSSAEFRPYGLPNRPARPSAEVWPQRGTMHKLFVHHRFGAKEIEAPSSKLKRIPNCRVPKPGCGGWSGTWFLDLGPCFEL